MNSTPQAPHLPNPVAEAARQRHGVHPGQRQYVGIAVVLAIITGLEVLVWYADASNWVLVPILIVLAISKFSLVALWFMHLKFDSRFFSTVFVFGIILAITVFVVVLSLLRVFFAP